MAMFEVGKVYDIDMPYSDGGRETVHNYEAIEIDGPLVKFAVPGGGEEIINTHSSEFVGARLSGPPQSY